MVNARTHARGVCRLLTHYRENMTLMGTCRVFLHPLDITFERLQDSAIHLGDGPQCFNVSTSGDGLRKEQKSIEKAIKEIPRSANIKSLFSGQFNPALLPFFTVTPDNSTRLLKDYHVDAKSSWILDLLMDQLESQDKGATYELYKSLGG
jgi:hypothetical protein